jgi:hypothetical protein
VTTVPPSVGPEKGKSPLTTSETSSNRTPLAVYSCPFVLTSTGTYPPTDHADADADADAVVVLHTTDDSLTYDASTDVALKRQRSAPSASAASEKPLPTTVTGVPPSEAPRNGHTDDTAAAGRYVNATPLDENCCPFIDTSTRRGPDDDDGGAAHSAIPGPTTRAAAVATLDSKRQRIVADSRKLPDEPKTDTRVPPDTGPDGGTTSLTCSAPCT